MGDSNSNLILTAQRWNLKVCTIHLGMLPKPYLYDFVVGEQRQPARESDIAIRQRRWAYAAPAAPNDPLS